MESDYHSCRLDPAALAIKTQNQSHILSMEELDAYTVYTLHALYIGTVYSAEREGRREEEEGGERREEVKRGEERRGGEGGQLPVPTSPRV